MNPGESETTGEPGIEAPEPGESADETAPGERLSRRAKYLIGGAVVVLLAFGVATAWLVRQIDPPGGPGDPLTIEIAEGTSKSRIAELLDERGVITSARIFRLYMRVVGAGEFQAGLYRRGELRENMAMGDVVEVLESGPEISYASLTIPEGFTLAQVADRVGRLPGRTAERFLEVANSGTVRSSLQPEGVDTLEGLLFPDTYLVAEDETEEEILARMVGLFDQVATEVGVVEGAVSVGLSPYEAVIVASLVEEETRVPDERPLVSAVIHNRLEANMLLQVDATVLYALGEHKEQVLFSDLEVDSPYNTYRYPGLPPTPIASPGEDSLRAAIEPADEDYLYYVKIDEDGSHAFAETQDGHERNIAEARRKGVR